MSITSKLISFQENLFNSLDIFLNKISIDENEIIIFSSIFAILPIIIWIYIFIRNSKKSRLTSLSVFFIGCFTAPILLGLQYAWENTNFDLAYFIENSIENKSIMWLSMFLLFAALEEIIKLYVVRFVDNTTNLIKTINDAVRFSILSALGFAFIENIYYLYQYWPLLGTPYFSNGDFLGMYFFRSTFTTCAHMIFSGIFGYYYGIGKFSIVMSKERILTKGLSRMTKYIAKIFKLPIEEGYRQKVVVKGLFLAIIIHTAFNYLLQYNLMPPVILFVIGGYIYLKFMLSRKTGQLLLVVDPKTQRESSMAKKDEDVVVELMGMWFEEEKYVDVLHMCQRLLERDPDNRVIKLFKAKALEEIDEHNPYKEIIDTVIKTQSDLSESERSIINTYTEEKEMFKKVKNMIKINTSINKEVKSQLAIINNAGHAPHLERPEITATTILKFMEKIDR